MRFEYMRNPMCCSNCGFVFDSSFGTACKECGRTNGTPIKIRTTYDISESELKKWTKKQLIDFILDEI